MDLLAGQTTTMLGLSVSILQQHAQCAARESTLRSSAVPSVNPVHLAMEQVLAEWWMIMTKYQTALLVALALQ
jgi:hypothetical protein